MGLVQKIGPAHLNKRSTTSYVEAGVIYAETFRQMQTEDAVCFKDCSGFGVIGNAPSSGSFIEGSLFYKIG